MRICDNGIMRDATEAECKAMRKAAVRAAQEERSKPMTEAEVSRMLLTRQVNTLQVDNNTALRMKAFYPTFESIIDQTVSKGFKFTCSDKLWEVIQPSLTIQSHYPPGVGTESLYAEICETHEGTEDDPIPYEGNMALENGKCYMQDYEVYRCIRDTGNPVYHALADLVGLYVEEVTTV